MNAFSRIITILLFFFGTWGSLLHANAEQEKHNVMLISHDSAYRARALLRGTQPDNANNEITTSSSSSSGKSLTTPSVRELAINECIVSSLSDLLSAVEDNSTCSDILFFNNTITISSDDVVVLDGRNKTLKPVSSPTYQSLFEVNGDADVEIHNFNMDGEVGNDSLSIGVQVNDGDSNVMIASCKMTNFMLGVSIVGDGASVTVRDSSIFGNVFSGVRAHGGTTTPPIVLVEGSTINDNQHGIYSTFANLSVERSTISQNIHCEIFTGHGLGGVDVTVSHSTLVPLSENPLLCAGQNNATVSLDNSILVLPSVSSTCQVFKLGGKMIDGGFNAIEGSEYPSCLDGQGRSTTTIVSDNLWLGDLDDNGGPTLTHSLLQGSPAIDAGNCSSFVEKDAFDQRGVVRPQGSGCDIGAYEFEVTLAGVIIESSCGSRQCINANAQKQRITIKKQVDSTFDATKVVDDSIVIPGYKVIRGRIHHDGDLRLQIEKDSSQNQNVVAGTTINVTGELLDGAVFAGTLSICSR